MAYMVSTQEGALKIALFSTVSEKYTPPMLADLTSRVIFSSLLGISLLRKINSTEKEQFGYSVGEKSASVGEKFARVEERCLAEKRNWLVREKCPAVRLGEKYAA